LINPFMSIVYVDNINRDFNSTSSFPLDEAMSGV